MALSPTRWSGTADAVRVLLLLLQACECARVLWRNAGAVRGRAPTWRSMAAEAEKWWDGDGDVRWQYAPSTRQQRTGGESLAVKLGRRMAMSRRA